MKKKLDAKERVNIPGFPQLNGPSLQQTLFQRFVEKNSRDFHHPSPKDSHYRIADPRYRDGLTVSTPHITTEKFMHTRDQIDHVGFNNPASDAFPNNRYLRSTERPLVFLPLDLKEEPEEFENEEINEKLKLSPIESLKKGKKYKFGNFDRYFSFHHVERWQDPRLRLIPKEYFLNKAVLDIGCNDGVLTIMIAMKYFPKKITGLDIDCKLINKAIENVKFIDKQLKSKEAKTTDDMEKEKEQQEQKRKRLEALMQKLKNMPKSFATNMGMPTNWGQGKIEKNIVVAENIDKLTQECIEQEEEEKRTITRESTVDNSLERGSGIKNRFPDNVIFKVENFIKDMNTAEKFDSITCFSTSKWIHLCYGDCGIRRFFKKVYDSLVKKGVFIFEPNEWRSYKKKKYYTEEFKQVIQTIRLKPKYFQNYLVQRLGFTLISKIVPPLNNPKRPGFKRTVYIYQKD